MHVSAAFTFACCSRCVWVYLGRVLRKGSEEEREFRVLCSKTVRRCIVVYSLSDTRMLCARQAYARVHAPAGLEPHT